VNYIKTTKVALSALTWRVWLLLLAVATAGELLAGCGAAPLVFSPEAGPNACIYTGTEVICETTLDACIVQGYKDTGRHDCDMGELVIASDGVTLVYRLGDQTGNWHMNGTNIVMESYTGETATVPLVENR
jgi:hypothetical protein